MSARDARGAVVYAGDQVVDLAKGPTEVLQIVSVTGDKVLLTSGVVTRADRVEVLL